MNADWGLISPIASQDRPAQQQEIGSKRRGKREEGLGGKRVEINTQENVSRAMSNVRARDDL